MSFEIGDLVLKFLNGDIVIDRKEEVDDEDVSSERNICIWMSL